MGKRDVEKIAPHCDFIFVHETVVKQVLEVMPGGDELQKYLGIPPGSRSCTP